MMKILKKNLPLILLTTVFFISTTSLAYASASSFIQDILWKLVNTVFGTFVGLAGLLLNVGVDDFVIGFGDKFLNSGVGVAVDLLWQSVRDIFNLTFIFALVYIGFKMILGSDDSNTRSWLAHLILAALLVNFSLYITKFIVDLSNITATEIVINGFPTTTGNTSDISKYFMNNLGLTSLLGDNGKLPENLTNGENSAWGIIFGTAMLYIVATFVFAVGGFMLIIRYAVLCLYMVMSPMMFLGWVFPNMRSYTSKYWSGFLAKAFYAPIYVLLIYFSHQVIDAYYNAGGSANKVNFTSMFASDGNTVMANFGSTFPPFILSCVFLISAVVAAQKLGVEGGAMSVNFGKNALSKVRSGVGYAAGGATFGAAAYAGRRSVGYAAQRAIDSDKFKSFAARNSIFGKGAYKATQAMAGSSFDGRNVAGLGKALNIGAGAKGGYAQKLKADKEADEKFLKSLGEVDIDNPKAKAEIEKRAAELKAEAEKEKVDLTAKKAKEETEVNNKKSTLSSEITNLKKQEFSASTKEEQDKIKKEREQKETDIQKIDQEYEAFNKTLAAQMKDIQKKAADALKQAETEKKYSHVISYMNELNKTEQFFNKAGLILSGGLFGGTGGAAAFGAVSAGSAGLYSAGVAAGGGAVSSYAYEAQSRRKALEKIYGKDGMKKADSERKKKKAKEYIEAASEAIDKEEPVKTAEEGEPK